MLKKLTEERAGLITKMEETLSAAKVEERAMSEEELEAFNELKKKVADIDGTIQAIKDQRSAEEKEPASNESTAPREESEARADEETRAFADYIRGVVTGEQRADQYVTQSDNGAVIPSTIANKIISKVRDICPIYEKAEKYNVKGTLAIPYIDETGTTLTMGYQNEMEELESTAMKLKTIDLSGFLAGILTVISKKFLNNTDINIVDKVTTMMAEQVALFIEKECLSGTAGKIEGLTGVKNTLTASSATAITGDDIIKLKDSLKTAFQQNAMFIMNPSTLTALRLLKDNNGRYLLQDDITSTFGNTILGKDVFVSDQMTEITANKPAIYYIDCGNALAVKVAEEFSMQVLQEKFATKHAIGIVGWMEVDAKIQNQQAVAQLVMGS